SRARLELRLRLEGTVPEANAQIGAVLVVVPVGARERPLRPFLPGDVVLLRREALLPFRVGFLHAIHHDVFPLVGREDLDLFRDGAGERGSSEDRRRQKERRHSSSSHDTPVAESSSIAWILPTSIARGPPSRRR